MSQRRRVLGASNGSLDSPVIFIGEAPGRLGADRFGIPLYGDQAGKNFELFLWHANLARENIFITNSVLCNPRTEKGNNDPPTRVEAIHCSRFLEETLRLVRPDFVVTLGAQALESLGLIQPHAFRLGTDVGKLLPWGDYIVMPLYHPAARAFVWRPREEQIKDYTRLGQILRVR
ncbi:MAG: uracil-DNA glycosylase [Chloroflexi bacterium]|nr:uracil-DNA glycosylase [Chloroflexota bacterium]